MFSAEPLALCRLQICFFTVCCENMLQPIMEILSSKRIVLASGSPRRRELLSNLNMKFEVEPSGFAEEDVDASDYSSPAEFVEELAFQKAMEVATRLDRVEDAPGIVIGADTVVTLNGKVYGKPSSRQDAVDMISRLSGVTHQVFSGVAVLSRTDHRHWMQERFSEVTAVTMDTLPDDVIQRYVDTGEPMDKAGGYGIQGLGGSLVSHIQGDYYNVVGLPVHKLCRLLYRLYSPGGNVFAAVKVY